MRAIPLGIERVWDRLRQENPTYSINENCQCWRCLRYRPVFWEGEDKEVLFTPTLLNEDTPLFV